MSRPFFFSFWFAMQTILLKRSRPLLLAGLSLLSVLPAFSQPGTLTGQIQSQRGAPVPYASIYLKNSTDAATADSAGVFSITTALTGNQVLVISAVGFAETEFPIVMEDAKTRLQIKLKNTESQLSPVVITAGTMEATSDRVLSIIKPVDVMSNASSTGDIVGAFQNFPGVQRNGGDQSGLFVRGGDASETMMIMDGITVQNPFFSSVPGVGQRSRFNSFQIKGMAFSTGGYSARYGQALSSVLDLQSTDLPEKTTLAVGANVGGLMLAGGQKMGNNGLEYSATYTNFGPYYSLSKTNFDFYHKPVATNLSTRWISKTDNGGLFKMSVNYSTSSSGVVIPDPNNLDTTIKFSLHNENIGINASYKAPLAATLKLFTAVGYSNNTDSIHWGDTLFHRNDDRLQARAELTWHASGEFKLTAGGEVQHYGYAQQFDTLKGQFGETLTAGYAEAEYKPLSIFAVKPGVRAEYSQLLHRGNIVPRLALALKTGPFSQLGAAGGMFYQSAATQYLLVGYRPSFQKAVHYLVNYEWIERNRSFRIEGYYKNYSQLVRENGVAYSPNPYRYDLGGVTNTGFGYARGFDIFWRDKASIKNIDYWLTYSYIDTKRLYQNYPVEATPDFVSTHNFNAIVKYYSDASHMFISAAYNYASGRPYFNPAGKLFLHDKAPAYQNVSLKVSYLTNFQRVFAAFYVNVDDLTGRKNVLGYRYSTDNTLRSPVLPPQYRAVFVGVYLSLSKFKKDDL